MTRTLAGLAALAAALGLSAARADTPPPEKNPGRLDVFDEAKLFSPAGVEKAKEKFRETQFHHGLTVTVDTVKEPPADKKSAAESAQHDKTKWRTFMLDWARETAKADRAKGVYVLITLHPTGGVAVIADKQTTQRGFTEADDQKVRDILIAALKEAKAEKDEAKQPEVRSAGLLKAVEYVAGDLKDTRVADLPPAGTKTDAEHRGGTTHANQPRQGGSGIMGYVCLGLFVLAGAWLVIGLIRMFTGGGGGGAGAPGGGGGGGGFMTSLLGGLFGAAAGMWAYNHFFGGGSMFGGGSDAYAGDAGMAGGDAGGGGGADPGAGDWGGGSGAAGGFDDGGGDIGGGDVGGGGGDFGGDF